MLCLIFTTTIRLTVKAQINQISYLDLNYSQFGSDEKTATNKIFQQQQKRLKI